MEPEVDIVLISKDLMVGSQLSAVARQYQRGFRQVSSLADPAIQAGGLSIVLVDLSHVDVAALPSFIPVVRANSNMIKIMAFGPHVHGERLQAARDTGCVIAHRGGVVAQLKSWLT